MYSKNDCTSFKFCASGQIQNVAQSDATAKKRWKLSIATIIPVAYPGVGEVGDIVEMMVDTRYTLSIKIHEIGNIFLVLPTLGLNSKPGYAPA